MRKVRNRPDMKDATDAKNNALEIPDLVQYWPILEIFGMKA